MGAPASTSAATKRSLGWGSGQHPTVKYLLVLVTAEMFLYGVVRKMTRHGG